MQLYTPSELDHLQQDLPYLIEIMEWVKSFVARHHSDLGRTGFVCPFVPYALKSNSIKLTVIRAKNLRQKQIEEIVLNYRDVFLDIVEAQQKELALYKVFLLVFADLPIEDTAKLIDGIQQKLKPFFVESGLMLGEFYKQNESPGLHNPNFRPLRSPIPMLVIRFMVESDLPFLDSENDPHLRIKYLEAYLRRFSQGRKDETKLINAQQALALAKQQIGQEIL
ncbi:DUF6875 domain-containing protein [Nostoc sp.]|uniref:DUF6875 domain-containing protein n=1 Tax=Nostoc sp. TaxID=1180 RepID=UPI002FFB00EA